MRYARCGEHLKIRLHSLDSDTQFLRDLLAAAQTSYFMRLTAETPVQPVKSTPNVPPIDLEDRAEADYPDRTFLWTAYLRTPLSLGVEPFLHDDGYLELLTRCLASGTELLLERIEAGQDGSCPHPLRRKLFLNGLLLGLAPLHLSERERALYLLYHRDTLLRYLRKKKHWTADTDAMARVVAYLDRQVACDPEREALGRAVLPNELTEQAWRWQADMAVWCGALLELETYVRPLLGDPLYHIDPFAERPLFPILFKVLHGFSNQIGLDPLNEAFLLHLLAGIIAEPELLRRPVRLRPDFLAMEQDSVDHQEVGS